MRYWLTTDTHFGHDKMQEYCGRPKGFEDLIFKNLKRIGEDDVLIHLGDFCIGRDAYWHEIFSKYPFRKILIRGNHDQKTNHWYMTHGWDFACENFLLTFEGKRILFSHAPTIDDGTFDVNIHGHFHNTLHRLLEGNWVVEGEKERNEKDLKALTEKHKLLAIEYTNYWPVLLEKFLTQPPQTL